MVCLQELHVGEKGSGALGYVDCTAHRGSGTSPQLNKKVTLEIAPGHGANQENGEQCLKST